MENENKPVGTFEKNLLRSNKQLREDRGRIIVNGTKKEYRRIIEDLEEQLDNIRIDQENSTDINPGNTHTIVNPSDFDGKGFCENDIKLGVKARNIRIQIEVATERYEELFGVEYKSNINED